MNNTLYEITDKYLKVLDNLEIDEETGEILNAEELDELSGAFEEKSEAVACYIKNSEVFIGDLKAEEANLAKRRKQTEKRIDYLKNVLTACLDAAGRDKVETTKVRVSFRKSVAVCYGGFEEWRIKLFSVLSFKDRSTATTASIFQWSPKRQPPTGSFRRT